MTLHTRREYYVLFMVLTALSSSHGGDVSTLSSSPEGYEWYESTEGVGSLLKPDGWFVTEESSGDTKALFITRENIEVDGGYITGMSVNQINNFSKTYSGEPSHYAVFAAEELALTGEVLLQDVVTCNAYDMNILRVKLSSSDIIIHYIIVGMDSTDQVYILMFEAPENLWEQDKQYGEQILDLFILG